MILRTIDTLTVGDISEFPVWRFVHGEEDVSLEPVRRLPCRDLAGKIAGVQLTLADGARVWGIIGNFDPANPRLNEHFVTASIESNGSWFHLARYHDHDYDQRGPAALAAFLGRQLDSVFPISFDLTGIVQGEAESLKGAIPKEPEQRLTRAEIIALAVP
jgi:hypothetical protein